MPFPHNFVDVVKVVFKRLFRVYAHIYHSHFKHVCSLGEEAHLNTCFKHFMYFAQASAATGHMLICMTSTPFFACSSAAVLAFLLITVMAVMLQVSFVQVFELIEQRELAPLQQLIDQMVR